MKFGLNKKGFIWLEGLVILLVVVIIGVIGWFVWQRTHKSGTSNTNSPSVVSAKGIGVIVKDGQLVGSAGKPVRLIGVDASGTEKSCLGHKAVYPGPMNSAEAEAMASWHLNAVRVPLNEDCWLGINGVKPAVSGVNYQNAIEKWVGDLNSAGMIAILDLHFAAPGDYLSSSEWPMADEDHAPTFWTQVATTFKNNPDVIFDLFNEPKIGAQHPDVADWRCWLNGCATSFTLKGKLSDNGGVVTYQTAGMQQLVNIVRATGAKQPLMIGGLRWAGDPCGVYDSGGNGGVCEEIAHKPKDPLDQLTIDFHTYLPNSACKDISCWNTLAAAAQKAQIPIITGEFGEKDCSSRFIDSYMNWADQHNVSYLAWSWSVNKSASCIPGSGGANHSLLQSWYGTSTTVSPNGASYKAHVAQLFSQEKI